LFEVIGALESLAGRLACEHLTDAELCEIHRICASCSSSGCRRFPRSAIRVI
jgi:hypothetical protein